MTFLNKISFILLINFYLFIILIDAKNRFCLIKEDLEPNNETLSINNYNCLVYGKLEVDNWNESTPVSNICYHLLKDDSSMKLYYLNKNNDKIVAATNTNVNKFENICKNTMNGLLLWITWNDFINQIKPDIQVAEGYSYMARSFINETFIYCKINLNNGDCIGFNEEIVDNRSLEILLELLPVGYDMRDIKFSEWKNITTLKTTGLAYKHLTNLSPFAKYIDETIDYTYNTKMDILLPLNVINGRPITMNQDNGVTKFTTGETYTNTIIQSEPIIRRLPGNTLMNVTLEGTWIRMITDIDVNLVRLYDTNEAELKEDHIRIKTKMIETKLANINNIYGHIVNLLPPTTEDPNDYTTIFEEMNDTLTTYQPIPYDPQKMELSAPNGIYPEFKQYATIATCIFVSVCLIAFFDVSRKLLRDKRIREAKKHYYKNIKPPTVLQSTQEQLQQEK